MNSRLLKLLNTLDVEGVSPDSDWILFFLKILRGWREQRGVGTVLKQEGNKAFEAK